MSEKIQSLIAHSPTASAGYWGIEVADTASGAIVFKLNADNFFVPASNTKLFTTAMTLARLGAHLRIQTTVTALQPPDPDGVLSCDLVLKGAGDPSLKTADIEALADQVAAKGIRRIVGSVIGDDTAFVWEPYNPGWSIDDAVEGYGAPISALTLNDNEVILHVRAGELQIEPSVPLFSLDNQLKLDEALPSKIHYERLPGSPVLHVWGALHATTPDPAIELSVDDPARYAALVFLSALQKRGIEVTGKAESRHRLASEKGEPSATGIVIATHDSAPLLEDLRVTDKTSQNLHAETYLRLISAQAMPGQGARADGLAQLKSFLDKVGVDSHQYTLQDGSGLSRLNLVTPHAIASLLLAMSKSVHCEDWISMLPVGGVDGTLEHRMTSSALKGRVIAKTGSLTHVTALSGYLNRRTGKRYAFSMLVNNYNGPAKDVRDVMEKICSLLLD